MPDRTFLDWNATAPLRPAAREAMLAVLDAPGNASSVHAEGRAARQMIEEARRAVAALVGAAAQNVTFTSGGTEASVLALTPGWERSGEGPRTQLYMSAMEHPSVLKGHGFAAGSVETIQVTPDGCVDVGHLADLLAGSRATPRSRPLVSVMAANNETGVVQPLRAVADLVHAAGGLLHVDAVQAAGRIPIAIADLGADLLTISGHKLGGPQGVGALVRRDASLHLPAPIVRGGGQERSLRAGTESVAALAGFGAAALEAVRMLETESERLCALRARLEDGLRALSPHTVIFGGKAERVPNTTLLAVPGMAAETALMGLDLDGIAVSSGAACSSGKVAPSHVLAAMGVPETLARAAIRVSLGFSTEEEDVERFLRAWKRRVDALGKGSQGIAA